LRIGAYHGGVDREPFQIAIGRDGFEDPIKHTRLNPSIVTPLGCLVGTKPVFREVTPASPRTCQPQHCIQKTTTIAAGTALPLATARHEPLQSRPLVVSQHFAFHASLLKPALNQNYLPKGILKLSPQPSKPTIRKAIDVLALMHCGMLMSPRGEKLELVPTLIGSPWLRFDPRSLEPVVDR
jgi:hypothetical protein